MEARSFRMAVSCAGFLVAGLPISAVTSGCAARSFDECGSKRPCTEDSGGDAGDEEPVLVEAPGAGSGGGAGEGDATGGGDASAAGDGSAAGDAGDAGGNVAVDDARPPEPDAPVDAGECPTAELLCGSACVPDDPRNCGACGHDCTGLPNVAGAVACVAGACTFDAGACLPGFAHCTGSPDVGCETSLATRSNCGSCANACTTGIANAEPICSGGACAYECPLGAPTPCEGSCVDLETDGSNCGSCGKVCTGGMTCQGGGCGCPGGTHDCNGTCVGNSSTATCGTTSCVPCPVPANGAATCDGSSCGMTCDARYSQCGDACVDETKDGNCGGCGITCGVSCASSQCIGVTALAAGYAHTCALLSNGTVECWGANDYGQLGYPTSQTCGATPCSLSPKVVPGLAGVAAISAGLYHTCAALADGSVQCWGLNDTGQVGMAPGGSASSPVVVPYVAGAISVAAGAESTCALTSGGTLECWGSNGAGQLGTGSLSPAQSSTPAAVIGVMTAASVVVGEAHACSLESDQTVACWGDDSDDELGSAPMTCDANGDQCSPTPVAVTALSGVGAVAAGSGLLTCALVGGNAECWGYLQGGLGDQAETEESATPVVVDGVYDATALTVGPSGACVLLSAGSASCWGAGPLGDGTTQSSTTPVAVSTLTGPAALAVGGAHTCALLSTGAVSCWSENSLGQLGDGTTTPALTPTPVLW